ncbi:MAG: nuclear transport factor 2 family protein [Phycisphaerae bacterium]|nr:nuclear transport factor 2 family protein [Saprospiraceae bacterium]
MKNIHLVLFCFALLLFCPKLSAQKQKPDDAEKAIKTTINRFFEGMEKGDTALLKSSCTTAMVLQTYMADKEGKMQIYTEEFADFLATVGAPGTDQYEERIKFEAIHAEKSLASVWTPYSFYINGKRSHCGTNSFQLVKTTDGWKIQYIIDTRRKQGCELEKYPISNKECPISKYRSTHHDV